VRRRRNISGQKQEEGIVIVLVAVALLFIVGAMAALAIDLVTFYTARSEAQLAADGAALAGARVLANSGMTSGNAAIALNAMPLAITVATQVATNNLVGGRNLNTGEVNVTFPNQVLPNFTTNPKITVVVQRADLPTFFARIWGSAVVTVKATATAEAYNPSGSIGSTVSPGPPVAPVCVKPWLLPNIDPTTGSGIATASNIFVPATGTIVNPSLIGHFWPNDPSVPLPNPTGLSARCGDCSPAGGGIPSSPLPGLYYPGAIDAGDFPVPAQALPSCSTGFNDYQLAVAGCVQKPIGCGATVTINIDTTPYLTDRNADTAQAAGCLIHYKGALGDTDSIDPAAIPSPPFQFLAGNANPVFAAVGGRDVLVSNSLVTVPVFDSTGGVTSPVTVIGFLQIFLNPNSAALPANNQLPATIINMAGCGTAAGSQPILGNGSSSVTVRLLSQ
jgi:Putative Flp pilus-assembly TadE/G-like